MNVSTEKEREPALKKHQATPNTSSKAATKTAAKDKKVSSTASTTASKTKGTTTPKTTNRVQKAAQPPKRATPAKSNPAPKNPPRQKQTARKTTHEVKRSMAPRPTSNYEPELWNTEDEMPPPYSEYDLMDID